MRSKVPGPSQPACVLHLVERGRIPGHVPAASEGRDSELSIGEEQEQDEGGDTLLVLAFKNAPASEPLPTHQKFTKTQKFTCTVGSGHA